MNRYKYKVYYEYKGPSHSNPLRIPKDSLQIADALRCFSNELLHYIPDHSATVSSDPDVQELNSITVGVLTTLDEAAMDSAVKRCLNGLDLFGEKLTPNFGKGTPAST